jgi:hypothetical protein
VDLGVVCLAAGVWIIVATTLAIAAGEWALHRLRLDDRSASLLFWLLLAIWLAGFFGAPIACMRWKQRARAWNRIRASMRRGACPGCGYALWNLLRADSREVRCPECGLAVLFVGLGKNGRPGSDVSG